MGRSRPSRRPRHRRSPLGGAQGRDQASGGAIPEVDLHGQRPEQALRTLGNALYTARRSGAGGLTVITGRGLSNATQEPVLRRRVEAWLAGEGRRYGVTRWAAVSRGGALRVELASSDPT